MADSRGGGDSRGGRGETPRGQRGSVPAGGGSSGGGGGRGGQARSDQPRGDRRESDLGRGGQAGRGAAQGRRDGRVGSAQGRRDDGGFRSSSRRPVAGERTADQVRYDGPDLPEEITGKELDRNVAAQLRGLPEKLAARVARHLVAAGHLLDTDPEAAYQHALAARSRASRVAVVREATGEAAYAAGHFAEALAELRAAKRMNGAIDYLPVMADCERALGRPERALELAQNPSVARLPTDQQIEMTIVEAGARADLGEMDGALRTLEHAPIRSIAREDWVVRLRYAYAATLLRAGRREDALEWFHRAAGIDGNQITDAPERVAELSGGEDGTTLEG